MVDFSLRVAAEQETCPKCNTKLEHNSSKCSSCGAEKIIEVHAPQGLELTRLLSLGGITGLLYLFLLHSPREYGTIANVALVAMACVTLYELISVVQGKKVPVWMTPKEKRVRLIAQASKEKHLNEKIAEAEQKRRWERRIRGERYFSFGPNKEDDFDEIVNASRKSRGFDIEA